jgi:hypothetical protein
LRAVRSGLTICHWQIVRAALTPRQARSAPAQAVAAGLPLSGRCLPGPALARSAFGPDDLPLADRPGGPHPLACGLAPFDNRTAETLHQSVSGRSSARPICAVPPLAFAGVMPHDCALPSSILSQCRDACHCLSVNRFYPVPSFAKETPIFVGRMVRPLLARIALQRPEGNRCRSISGLRR